MGIERDIVDLRESFKRLVENEMENKILADDPQEREGHSEVPYMPEDSEDLDVLEKRTLKEEEETIGSTDPERVDPGEPGAYDKKIYKIPFSVDQVHQAYIGKPHKCMCGCSGTYYTSRAGLDAMAKDDYRKDQEPNEEKIQKIYNKMVKNALNVGVEVIDDYIFTEIIGATQYTIYLHD